MTTPSPQDRPAAMRVAPCAPETATAADVLPQLPPAVSAAVGLFGDGRSRGQRLTDDLRAAILADTRAGLGVKAICRDRHTSHRTVAQVRADAGLKVYASSPRPGAEWSPEMDDTLMRMAAAGETRVAVAGELGLHISTVTARSNLLDVVWHDKIRPAPIQAAVAPPAANPAPRHVPTGHPFRGITATGGLGTMSGRPNHMLAARQVAL